MNKILINIKNEIENSLNKKIILYGYHKDFLQPLVDEGYTLVFRGGDMKYPAQIMVSGYIPKYGYPIY